MGGNQFSASGVSPKWVKSKRRRKKRRERKKERLNDGNNNGQATHGARKHAWRTQARMTHASRLGQWIYNNRHREIEERAKVNDHAWTKSQWKQWPASLPRKPSGPLSARELSFISLDNLMWHLKMETEKIPLKQNFPDTQTIKKCKYLNIDFQIFIFVRKIIMFTSTKREYKSNETERIFQATLYCSPKLPGIAWYIYYIYYIVYWAIFSKDYFDEWNIFHNIKISF